MSERRSLLCMAESLVSFSMQQDAHEDVSNITSLFLVRLMI